MSEQLINIKPWDSKEALVLRKDVAFCSQFIFNIVDSGTLPEGEIPEFDLPKPSEADLTNEVNIKRFFDYAKDWVEKNGPFDDGKYKKEKANRQGTVQLADWEKTHLDPLVASPNSVELFDLLLTANYMDFQALLDSCCRAIAHLIKGKTPEEIRTIFNVPEPKADSSTASNNNNNNNNEDE